MSYSLFLSNRYSSDTLTLNLDYTSLEKLEKRFWSKVEKTPSCWIWKAGKYSDGYGQFRVAHRKFKAHRVAWALANSTTTDLFLLHSCDNPLCVNPQHLRAGTQVENMQDREARQHTFHPRGELNPKAKFTLEQIQFIRVSTETIENLAKKFQTTTRYISSIKSGRRWASFLI